MLSEEKLQALKKAGCGGMADVRDFNDAIDELLSLRSLPEMGEVDAIEDWLEGKEIEFGVVRRIKRLVEMVGQLSAALTEERKRAEEVVGLLKWWVDFKDGFGQIEGISAGSAVNEWKENASRILAVCGKGDG